METNETMMEEVVLTNEDPVAEATECDESEVDLDNSVDNDCGTNVPAIAAIGVGIAGVAAGTVVAVKKFKAAGGIKGVLLDIEADHVIRKRARDQRKEAHRMEKENLKKQRDEQLEARIEEKQKKASPATAEEVPEEPKKEEKKKGK